MKNILCVDFVAAPETGYEHLLRTAGYKSIIGTVGQVIPELRSGRLSADMVIVKCHALNAEGEDLLGQLKRAAPDIPFLLMTNEMTVASYLRAQAIGIHEYLGMPVSDGQLLSTVRTLLRDTRLQNKSSSEKGPADAI